ncbi:MAG: transglutaminase-like domain-containing protein, partial [Planctomycetota bacterium]
AVAKIEELVAKFEFGSELALRKSLVAPAAATYSFTPKPQQQDDRGACVVSKFAQPPRRLGVPFVTATMEIAVDDTGFRPGQEPGAALTASTSFWPAADKEILALAQRITGDKKTAAAKVAAILAWTAPGKQITYGGQTGSRWGTAQVLAQKYGHCWDFSDCFVTLARAAGVPSRQVAGWLHGSSGHVWAEYYDAARRGWQQVDPTGGGQLACGIYHIPYFTSEAGEMPILYLAMPRIEVVATTGP